MWSGALLVCRVVDSAVRAGTGRQAARPARRRAEGPPLTEYREFSPASRQNPSPDVEVLSEDRPPALAAGLSDLGASMAHDTGVREGPLPRQGRRLARDGECSPQGWVPAREAGAPCLPLQ